MSMINYASREINCKLVYYGPGLGGKTTNLEHVYQKVAPTARGKMISLATETERTLFFDFLPVDLGTIRGFKVKFHLYTVPGQVYYNASRKLILKGVDGVVFVADSQIERTEANIEAMQNLYDNMVQHGYDLTRIPFVIQYNKRDLPNAVSIALLQSRLNPRAVPHFEAVASKGDNVLPTLKSLSKLVLDQLNERYGARSIAVSGVAMRVSEMPVRSARTATSEQVGAASAATPAFRSTGVTAEAEPPAPVLSAPIRRTPDVTVVTLASVQAPHRRSTARPASRPTLSARHVRHASKKDRTRLVILICLLVAAALTGVACWFLG